MLLGKQGNPDYRSVRDTKISAYSKLAFKVSGMRWSIRIF